MTGLAVEGGWCPITELHGTAALPDESGGKSREK